MGKGSLTLVLVAAVLTVKASSQEIVIEPTNGRAPTTNHGSRPDATRPAAVESAPLGTRLATKSATKSVRVKKIPANQIAAKPKPAPVETGPSVSAAPEAAKSEAAEAAPAPQKAPERRPAWAMADTREAGSLQNEIASALAHDPKLAGSAIQVSVDEGSVTLQGRTAGSQEHLQAQRLAQSYAWNRKLVDHILVDHSEVQPSMAAQK